MKSSRVAAFFHAVWSAWHWYYRTRYSPPIPDDIQ